MPELPEVETIKNTLEKKLTGHYITGTEIYLPKVIGPSTPEEFKKKVKQEKIKSLSRRGKYLLIHITGNKTLVIQLRMTGKLIYMCPQEPVKHTHVVFYLDNNKELHFIDMRQFGKIILTSTNELNNLPGLKKLGVEPLGSSFTRSILYQKLRRCRVKLKSLLLDQTFIAGIGNIYADEALHRALLNPQRTSNTLNTREITRLYHAIREVLHEGIVHRGTSFSDYVDGTGNTGNFQEHLRVYSKEGHPCPNCGTKIKRIKISGRSSYFCPYCQRSVN
ncbi:MAG: bifunctional DNA-formamidopyrimidine glycosylase/DNA-(apurinic or apyrimidinic site) lyase [Clostridiales bacterium]|nr:bifunctional DNA-formamidopyrimidine glycosylase/DNA-(apurinic or apyrimidinic site) lyase [Clostridiales bacterium]MCF8022367.1 bifunctional DNA-formamidopyrimidine glycosylase/DNA-(apurinic or apyrimidinic site) lyase [Clostridiales bacterium]